MNKKIENLNEVNPTTFYTTSQMADLFQVTERTIRKYCLERVFPNAVKVPNSRKWLIPGSDIVSVLIPSR